MVLGDATRALHRSAERTRAMGALLRGTLSREAYVLLIRNLHAVYRRLEDGLAETAASGQPLLRWLDQADLQRAPALEEDLAHLHGPGWQEDVPLLPATEIYLATLRRLEEAWPLGLAAHAWVRYMGDLSGGQVLARVVARHYGLEAPDGVRAYRFPGDTEEHKKAFRHHLDRIPASEHPRMVEEARAGFAHSIDMLDEVADRG